MIERYSRKEIKSIWDEKNKYKIWLSIEITAAQAMEKLKLIPKGVALKTQKKAKINVKRIHQIESKVHHDVIAFLTSITELLPNLPAVTLRSTILSVDTESTPSNASVMLRAAIDPVTT